MIQRNSQQASAPRSQATAENASRIRITWERGAYFVNIPNYQGGEVVRAEAADALRDALADWFAFAKEELSEFDIEGDDDCSGEMLCPKCQNSGCIQRKIRNTRKLLEA